MNEVSYKFRCEYCGEEYTGTTTFYARLTEREREKIQKNAEKWKYDVPESGKCPHCGFVPTFMINRMQPVFYIVLTIFVLVGILSFFFMEGMPVIPVSATITLGLVCFLPLVAVLVLFILQLIPNRKLLKKLSSTDRQLSPPTRPQIFFGSEMNKQEIIREIEQLGSTDASLKMALSPLLSMLTSGSAVNYSAAALTLAQLADGFEKTVVADATTIINIRKIEANLKML